MQINNIIEDVYALLSTHLRHAHISFELHTDPELPGIPGLGNQLRQVVLNLFMNAVDAMVNMIALARGFDMQMKMLQNAETNARQAAQLLTMQG